MLSSNVFSASVSVTGPTNICSNPSTGVYTIDASYPFFCGRLLEIGISGGTVNSIVDSRGRNLPVVNPTGPNVLLANPPRGLPWTVTVTWTNPGCNSISARVATPGLFCNCDETETLNVQVGSLNAFDFSINSPTGVTPCESFTLCVGSPEIDCVDSFDWSIGGDTFSSTTPCVEYTITNAETQCPLGVIVDVRTGCGDIRLFEGIACGPVTTRPFNYPSSICGSDRSEGPTNPPSLFNRTTICAPGIITGVRRLFPTPNSLPITTTPGSFCFTINTSSFCGDDIRLEVSYDVCGQVVTEIITIEVRCCDGDIPLNEDVVVENRSAVSSDNANVLLKPNPVVEYMELENVDTYEHYSIFSLSGKIVGSGKIDAKKVKVKTAEFESGMYLIMLSNNQETKTLKFIKN